VLVLVRVVVAVVRWGAPLAVPLVVVVVVLVVLPLPLPLSRLR
jgi:hypothetical protein